MTQSAVVRAAAMAVCIALATLPAPPAYAISVFDGANYSQNLLQAARALTQINNQIRSLANQAQMLIYQARNLDRLSFSAGPNLLGSLGQIQGLMHRANGIAYRVSGIDATYSRLFPEQYSAAVTGDETVRDAQEAWRVAREGYRHSLEVQAGVVEQVETDAAVLDIVFDSFAIRAAKAGLSRKSQASSRTRSAGLPSKRASSRWKSQVSTPGRRRAPGGPHRHRPPCCRRRSPPTPPARWSPPP